MFTSQIIHYVINYAYDPSQNCSSPHSVLVEEEIFYDPFLRIGCVSYLYKFSEFYCNSHRNLAHWLYITMSNCTIGSQFVTLFINDWCETVSFSACSEFSKIWFVTYPEPTVYWGVWGIKFHFIIPNNSFFIWKAVLASFSTT